MNYLPISGIPMIEEHEATGELAEMYAEVKEVFQMPFVPNFSKAVAISAPVLTITTDFYRTLYKNITLPEPLIAMISYCIPTARNCTYCSANNELHCRSLGIDEDMLNQLARDLGNVNPQRLRTIIQFAVKCSLDPQSLVAEDYDQVRDQGISDEELLEIILIASVANFTDTMADALKIEIDEVVVQALAEM